MKIDVFFTADQVDAGVVSGRTAVVVDVVRATSTIVTALAHGARAIFPTVSTEEALKLASSLGRDETLLCGERKGLKMDGFDLGNSPAEFTEERIEGKRLVMSTTNGTRALHAATGASRVVVGSLLNLSATAAAVADADELVVICAGREGVFSLDDAVCAGYVLKEIGVERGDGPELNDGARACLSFAEAFEPDAEFLARTAAGKALADVGLESDLPLCAAVDRHPLVAEMEDRSIRVVDGGGG